MKTSGRFLAVFAVSTILIGFAQAATVKLQSGLYNYNGASDTWLNETAGNQRSNYGGSPTLTIRYDGADGGYIEDCALLKFELPAVQADDVSLAVLELFYLQAGGMLADNAIAIKPYRVTANRPWFENNRNGELGEGASWRYFGQIETNFNEWTALSGGWYDKIDDRNSSNMIKRPGGTVPGAIEPTNWVPFTVTPSVQQWFTGAVNNGFILFSSSFQGSGNEAYGVFASRENSAASNRPVLRVTYAGAHISWTGLVGNVWNTSAVNWRVGNALGTYDDGDHVYFTDLSSQTNIVIGSPLAPASLTISNHFRTYSFSGHPLGGAMAITKHGAGTARLASSNRFGGTVSVLGGTFEVTTNFALGSPAAGTIVSTGAELRLVGNVPYTAPETLSLEGTLSAYFGQASWSGPVIFSPNARLFSQTGELVLDGPLSGTGEVQCEALGTMTFSGASHSSWTGAVRILRGTVNIDRQNPPLLDGDLWVGTLAPATAILYRAGQFLENARLAVYTNSLLLFYAGGAAYRLNRLVLRGGTMDAGISAITLARTVTAEAASSPSQLKGAFALDSTNVVFYVGASSADSLIVDGSLQGGGVDKMGFGDLVLAGANTVSSEWRVGQGGLVLAHPQGLGNQSVWVNGHSSFRLAVAGAWSNTLRLQGSLFVAPPATNAVWSGPIEMSGGGHTIAVSTGACLVLDTSFASSTAWLTVRGGGTLVVKQPLDYGAGTQASNIVIAVSNTAGSALGSAIVQLWNGATLKGRGIVNGPVWVESGGALMGGDPGGVLSISNNIQINAGGFFVWGADGGQRGRLDLRHGGMLMIHSNALLAVNGILEGTNPIVMVERAQDVKGNFFGLPPGSPLPWPNQEWYIHYQPNAIYVGRNPQPLWYLRAWAAEGENRLSWRTPIEIGVVSFDLYRREGAEWIKINNDPIPATHPQGGLYEWTDQTASPGTPYTYRLVQNLENGRSNIVFSAQRKFTPLEFLETKDRGGNLFEFRWRSRHDEIYRLESLDLLSGQANDLSGPIPATPEENVYTLTLPGSQGFYRVTMEP